jgi:hypothetical protein
MTMTQNEFNALVNADIQALMKPRKRLQTVCRCDAYPFPHRESGGACTFEFGEDTVEYDDYSIDEYMDDPRRGQAAWIKAGGV